MSIILVCIALTIFVPLITLVPIRYVLATLQNIRQSFVKASGLLTAMSLVCLSQIVIAQDFTSNASGVWTTGSNWVGGTAPPTTAQSYGIILANHDLTINGGYNFQGTRLDVAAGKTLRVNGTFSISNGAVVNVYGTLNITGAATLNAGLFIYPGGKVIVGGNLTIINATYLTVGTSVAPGSYSDLVVKENLASQNSGDIVINRNGRVVVYKNFTSDTNGGTVLTINSGGQIYINGNIALTGGGDNVTNGNGTTPIGFYVNGSVSATGGGAAVDTNRGTRATMLTNDKAFYDWVAAQPGSPLPITLLYVKTEKTGNDSITLEWATSSEENFDKFIVERSLNGRDFEPIGEVVGAGNSKITLYYSYVDQNPFIGKSYYRLKSIDNDGSYEYSKIVFTEFAGLKKMIIYPNPSTGEFINYSIGFDIAANDKIVVINSQGAEVKAFDVRMNKGEITFDKLLESGLYIIKYSSNHSQSVTKMVVK